MLFILGSISLNLTDRYQTPYTNGMQDLIIQIFFFFVTCGILYQIAQWIGFLDKDAPDGTPPQPGYGFLVVLILAIIVFVKYCSPDL